MPKLNEPSAKYTVGFVTVRGGGRAGRIACKSQKKRGRFIVMYGRNVRLQSRLSYPYQAEIRKISRRGLRDHTQSAGQGGRVQGPGGGESMFSLH